MFFFHFFISIKFWYWFHTIFSRLNNFICPYCKNSLELNVTSLKCHNNHTFDLTKKGTINFIASTKIKESKIYNEKLFTCRRKFIQKGYYEEVYNIIAETINSLNLNNLSILDLGCGEGTHTINILNKISGNYNYCAFDYSKSAINLASDYNSTNRFYFDGDVNNIPITTNSIDVIIDFLSPYSESEVKRVLKKGGMFIKVSPNKDYLLELRQALGLNEYQKQAKVIDNLAKHFKNISTKTYTKSFAISKEDQDNLIGMTPINTTQNSLEIPSITIDLNIYIIQN